MTTTAIPIPTHAAPTAADDSLQLVCSEIWGGNRPVNTRVSLPHVEGFLYSRPCEGGRGGDVHYLSVCGSGLLSRICLADVMGHGEAVSAVSTEVHRHLRRFMNQPDQRRVLRDLNRRLSEIGFQAMTTAAALTFYPPSFTLSLSYAGHPPAWHYSAQRREWTRVSLDDGAPRARASVNLPLAIDDATQFTRRNLCMESNDRILLITDGILEAPARDGELFGADRLATLLERAKHASLEDVASALLREVEDFSPSAFEADDVTFLLLQFGERPKAPAAWYAIRNLLTRPRGNSAAFK